MKPDFINQSICLSDIPKNKIKEDKNGRKWVNLTAALMRQEDKFGNTYAVYVSQGKDESRDDRAYVGKGREFCFENKQPTPETVDSLPAASGTNDLPF